MIAGRQDSHTLEQLTSPSLLAADPMARAALDPFVVRELHVPDPLATGNRAPPRPRPKEKPVRGKCASRRDRREWMKKSRGTEGQRGNSATHYTALENPGGGRVLYYYCTVRTVRKK